MLADYTNYSTVFLAETPLIDVRAPVEFSKGAFPHAVNLPLMNDSEREKVGTCYKRHGKEAAIALGNRLVSGASKDERIAAWAAFATAHPHGYIYCLHGGLRSQISQTWLHTEAGIHYPRIAGGYKALRNFLISTTQQAVEQCQFTLLGGLTGSGKTELLVHLNNGIDLEAHANHRGSSFGKHAQPQPSQVDFENALAIDLLKKRQQGLNHFVLEDESRLIGTCSLPLPLHQAMQHYPMVWLEDSLESRAERILKDYVVDLCAEFVALYGVDEGFSAYAERLQLSLKKIIKRLGNDRYQGLSASMNQALAAQKDTGATHLHQEWIIGLLTQYYDPMYLTQRAKKSREIQFSGNHQAVLDYLQQ